MKLKLNKKKKKQKKQKKQKKTCQHHFLPMFHHHYYQKCFLKSIILYIVEKIILCGLIFIIELRSRTVFKIYPDENTPLLKKY